ncbi:hypothetical protein LCGC14_3050880, partial [marine sediment metagenome]
TWYYWLFYRWWYFFHSAVLHQALLGNTQWLFVDFYQSEFAGRIATKVMQTSLAVPESVMKLLDVLMTGKTVIAIAHRLSTIA